MYFNYLPVGNWHGQKKATKWTASAGTPRWGHHLTMISQFIPLKSLISLYLSSSLISSHYQSYIICKSILTSHDIIHIYRERENDTVCMYVYIYIYTVTHCIILYQYCIIFYPQYIYPLYDICPNEASFLHSLTFPWHPTAWIEDNSTARHLEGRCNLQVSVQVTQPAWRNIG